MRMVFGWVVLAGFWLGCVPDGRAPNSDDTRSQPIVQACGNGEVNGYEACDGAAFRNGAACAGYGLGVGEVACDAECHLDFSGCNQTDYCAANDLYDNGQCDPCELLGGTIDPECATHCGADGQCSERFDPLVGAWVCRHLGLEDLDCGTCGNELIEQGELCDEEAFFDETATCEAWGFVRGEVTCGNDCAVDLRRCEAAQCGDGRVEGREVCDGGYDGTMTCASLGFMSGELRCGSDCQFDTSGCVAPPSDCGNGQIDEGEACDGDALAERTCVTEGFIGGVLSCQSDCQLDMSGCGDIPCGNGVIDEGEVCDTQDFGGDSCFVRGYDHGRLGCSANCQTVDESACQNTCGDGVVQALEICDGTNFRGNQPTECRLFGLGTGDVGCKSDCTLDLTQCEVDRCTAQGWYGDGVCDPCEAFGGEPDPDCEQCGTADGQCSTYYDEFTAGYTCALVNPGAGPDPDCAPCGDGVRDMHELCENTPGGLVFRDFNQGYCTYYGFAGGEMGCTEDCRPDVSFCEVE